MIWSPFLARTLPPYARPPRELVMKSAAALRKAEAGVACSWAYIQDKEPKYGLIVVGFVDPGRMLTKRGARPGDRLLLSKPLGTGVISTALKRELADPADVLEAVGWMKTLNRTAAELAVEFSLGGATDITGFSFLGHGFEMAQASGVGFRFFFERIPFIRGAPRYAQDYIFPGGSSDNRQFYGSHVQFAPGINEPSQMLLFDAQTSGGLLLCVPPAKLPGLLNSAAERGVVLWEVGEVVEGEGIEVLE
jgi:selenide,water dikinase